MNQKISPNFIKRKSTMLSNQPVTNLFFTYRDKGLHEALIIATEEVLVKDGVLDPRTGDICGCAVYYKTSKGDEIIYATGYYSSHGDISHYDVEGEPINISLTDDENTMYGFITNTGFFLNRKLAKKSYVQFCARKEIGMKNPEKDILISYDVNWGYLFKHNNNC
jgi:hypothetical protein